MLIVADVLLVSGSDCHAVSPALRYFIRYMMTLEVSAPAGGVSVIDTLHLPIAVIFGVSGFPENKLATIFVQ